MINFDDIRFDERGLIPAIVQDAATREVLTLASDWKLPVNLHVTDPDGRAYPGRVETPLTDFIALAREFPKLNFILSHWGGLLPMRDVEARSLTK